MKKLLTVLTVLSLLFASAVSFVTIWQGNNIKSILIGVMENTEEIERQREENQVKLVEDVSTYMDTPIREMTGEEKQKIENGETSVTDVYQQIFEEKSVEKQEGTAQDKDAIISRYMADLYKLQNEYTAKAEATITQGATYYESIKKHPQDAEARAATITHFTPVVRGIESECDTKVNTLISNLETELKNAGADTSIVASIRTTYAAEKKLKMSYYANKYLT